MVVMMPTPRRRCVLPWTNYTARTSTQTSTLSYNANKNPTPKGDESVGPPFTLRLNMKVLYPEGFKPPPLAKFDGHNDPYECVLNVEGSYH